MFNPYLPKVFSQFVTTTSQFTLSESNGLVYKPHPRFLAQNLSKKVRLTHESLRYFFSPFTAFAVSFHSMRSDVQVKFDNGVIFLGQSKLFCYA